MLSKAQSKYIRSLTQQKFRNEYKVFVAEGEKLAQEWLAADGDIQMVVATAGWLKTNRQLVARHGEATVHEVTDAELSAISGLQTSNSVLLVVPQYEAIAPPQVNEWCLALDEIQDPGNMGTIIRIADWFGIRHIVCGQGCVDWYNPKVVQSAMGGHLRVNMYAADLPEFLQQAKLPRLAAMLHGEPVYAVGRMAAGILIIGNESKGISHEVAALVDRKVTIPRKGGAESLNAGVSAGILCSLLLPV